MSPFRIARKLYGNAVNVRALSSLRFHAPTGRILLTCVTGAGFQFIAGIDPTASETLNQRFRQLNALDHEGRLVGMTFFIAGEGIMVREFAAEGSQLQQGQGQAQEQVQGMEGWDGMEGPEGMEEVRRRAQFVVSDIYFDHPLIEAAYNVPRLL